MALRNPGQGHPSLLDTQGYHATAQRDPKPPPDDSQDKMCA